MELRPSGNLRRIGASLPSAYAGSPQRQRKEDIGISQYVVVEEIPGPGLEVGDIEGPALERNCQAELALLIALPAQRLKFETILCRYVK